jgi:hypothetical protein
VISPAFGFIRLETAPSAQPGIARRTSIEIAIAFFIFRSTRACRGLGTY